MSDVLVWRRGGVEYKAVRPRFDAAKHPRDAHGRFINVGAEVSIAGGRGKGKITRLLDRGHVEVEAPDGTRRVYGANRITVTRDVGAKKPAASRSAPEPAAVAAPTATQAPQVPPAPAGEPQDLSASEANTWGKGAYPTRKDLPPEQREALDRYTGGAYANVNKYLRTGQIGPSNRGPAEQVIAGMDALLAANPTDRDVTVHRAFNLDVLAFGKGDTVGKEFTEPGYMSTTVGGKGVAGGFARLPVQMTLRVPAGTPSYYVGNGGGVKGERELVLGRGLAYRITSAKQSSVTGRWALEAEIVPDGDQTPKPAPSALNAGAPSFPPDGAAPGASAAADAQVPDALATDTPPVDVVPSGAAAELTEAQKIAQKQGWAKLPTGTVGELQQQLADVKPAAVPSVTDLIDGGKDPEAAAKEHKRLTRNANTNAWRTRTKLQAALDGLKQKDAAAGPTAANEVIADAGVTITDTDSPAALDKLLGEFKPPVALYDATPGEKGGPGAVLDVPWYFAVERLPLVKDAASDPIPVAGLTIQGRKVHRGWARQVNGRSYLVEQREGETADQALARLGEYAKAVDAVMTSVPEGQGHWLSGAALLDGPNPQDGKWAKQYNMPGFVSAATGGDGAITAWNGKSPPPSTIAHEFGHNVDAGLHLQSTWLSEADAPTLDGLEKSWAAAADNDRIVSTGWGGGRFKETRVGDKPITIASGSVSAYGATSPREDFAESVRLYLKDRREGKIGYDPTTGDNLRFSDVFPERARFLNTVFQIEDADYDTPARKRRMDEAAASFAQALDAGAIDENGPSLEVINLMQSAFGIRTVDIQEAMGTASAAHVAKKDAAEKEAAELYVAATLKAKNAAAAAAAKAEVETVKAALAAGLLDKGTADKFRARARAAKYAAKKKGLSEEEASATAAAFERALVQKWVSQNVPGGGQAGNALQPWRDAKLEPGVNAALVSKADTWLSKAGKVRHPLSKKQDGKDAQAKANIAAELANRLFNKEDWELFRAYQIETTGGDPGLWMPHKPANQRGALDKFVGRRVSQWAMSSGDSHDESVFMQIAAGEEFGLDAHPAPRMDKQLYAKLQKRYGPARAALYRRLARHMYEHTQEEFKKAGITHVSVYRGMHLGATNPSWAKDGVQRPQLQPLNSWSTRKHIAQNFGTTMLRAKVPVELIVGTAQTGFGCLTEAEFVIMDSDGGVHVAPSGVADKAIVI